MTSTTSFYEGIQGVVSGEASPLYPYTPEGYWVPGEASLGTSFSPIPLYPEGVPDTTPIPRKDTG